MRVFQRESGEFRVYHRAFGRTLDEHNISEGFRAFLDAGDDKLRTDVVDALLARIHDVLSWWDRQRLFRIYSSSLLLIYEGDVSSVAQYTHTVRPQDVEVRMIDFAHVFPALDNGHTDGYVVGLRNIMATLQQYKK